MSLPNNQAKPSEAERPEKTTPDSSGKDGDEMPSSEPTMTKVQSQSAGLRMSAVRRRTIMFSLCLALFLSALDVTIVATALPTIARSLGADAAQYAWVGSSYTLASTSSTPIWAKMSDIFGRKSMIMAANVTFMAGSIVSALAQNITMLLAGRVLQGLGGGGMLVLVTIIIGDLFELQDRAKYYGLTGIVWAIASSTGPLLGGVFTQTISWQWCFWINLPFDGASLIVLFLVLKVDRPHVSLTDGLKSLDWVGSVLIVGGTICFLYGLEAGAGGLQPWGSAMVICLLVFGILILASFFAYEAKLAKNPIIPIRIFSSTTNMAAFTTSCLHSFIFIAYDYFLPLYFQVVLAFTPIMSGLTLFALVIPLSFMTMGSGVFVRRTGNYLPPIWIGAGLMTLGTGLFIMLDSSTNWAKVIVFQIIVGVGAGPLFQCPMIALQSHLKPQDTAAAMSALSFMRSLMSSIAIVIGSVLLQRTLGGESLTLGSEGQRTESHAAAYVSALRTMWAFFTALCGAMLVFSFFIKSKDLRSKSKSTSSSDGEGGDGMLASKEKTGGDGTTA